MDDIKLYQSFKAFAIYIWNKHIIKIKILITLVIKSLVIITIGVFIRTLIYSLIKEPISRKYNYNPY